MMQMVSLRNHQRQRNPSLLDQQQQIEHFHCHVWVLVQHHAENPLLHTHTFSYVVSQDTQTHTFMHADKQEKHTYTYTHTQTH